MVTLNTIIHYIIKKSHYFLLFLSEYYIKDNPIQAAFYIQIMGTVPKRHSSDFLITTCPIMQLGIIHPHKSNSTPAGLKHCKTGSHAEIIMKTLQIWQSSDTKNILKTFIYYRRFIGMILMCKHQWSNSSRAWRFKSLLSIFKNTIDTTSQSCLIDRWLWNKRVTLKMQIIKKTAKQKGRILNELLTQQGVL